MAEAAFFTIGQSRTIGYGKFWPLVDYRSQSWFLKGDMGKKANELIWLCFFCFLFFDQIVNLKKQPLNTRSDLTAPFKLPGQKKVMLKILLNLVENKNKKQPKMLIETRRKMYIFYEMFNGRLLGQKLRRPKPKADCKKASESAYNVWLWSLSALPA